MSDDEWHALAAFTPARVAQGRAGNALPVRRVLEFQLAHARARDAVWTPFDAASIARELGEIPSVAITTNAADRHAYLRNPDLGRTLPEISRSQLPRGTYDAALVIADGLSATAVHSHGALLARAILNATPGIAWAPAVLVSQGRVAVGDAIAQSLGAQAAVVMIGERPGLSAADSLGLYLTHAPRPGITSDADRNCISNIRPEGLPLADAAHRLAWLMMQARSLGLSGVALKEDAPGQALSVSPAQRETVPNPRDPNR